MQIWVRGRVDCCLKERLEEVLDDVLKARDLVVQLVDVVEAGNLDQPQAIVRINLMCCPRYCFDLNAENKPYLRRPNWQACPIH